MLAFRMDEAGFAEGQRDGTRVVTGAGLKADFGEYAVDASTLGLWHLHNGDCRGEGTGLEDFGPGGHALQDFGADPIEDGYRFVRANGDYMDTPMGAQAALPAATLECWVREWLTPANETGAVATYYRDAANYFQIHASRGSTAAASVIRARLHVGDADVGWAMWQGEAVDALLRGSAPWHVAAVLDQPAGRLRLFVNGLQRAEDSTGIVPLPAGSYTLRLGRYPFQSPAGDVSAVIDEVRLSSAARYGSAFAPQRLVATGRYSSPVFDSTRIGARWTAFAVEDTVPSGTQITWEVRAGDAAGQSGEGLGVWQACPGPGADLPQGRYLQWRATLSTSSDGITSPLVSSVEVQASEAGYNLYAGTGAAGSSIDYAEPWLRAGPGVNQVETAALQAGTVHWLGIRPVRADGVETPVTACEVRLELEAAGLPQATRPAGALVLEGEPIDGGRVRLAWRYRVGVGGVAPAVFRLFSDRGTGMVDYSLPVGEVPFDAKASWFSWTSGALPDGVTHQLAVRAVAAGEVMDEQPAVVPVTPDAAAPGQVDGLQSEVVL